ncbi:MAG: tyrosine-type recombinase/integrase [Bacteroidia bacterium]
MKSLPLYNKQYEQYYQDFAKALQTKGYAKSEMYAVSAREFLFFLESKTITDVKQVKASDVIAYYEYLGERPNKRRLGGLSNSMIRGQLFALRLFFDYLTDVGIIEGSPARLPKFSIGKNGEREMLSVEETKELYQATKTKREKAILSLAYGCGLRRTEIQNLNTSDVQLSKGLLLVRDGKNHRSRTVPLSDSVLQSLREYLIYEREQYINRRQKHIESSFILNNSGLRMQGDNLYKDLKEILKRTTIKKEICLHSLRHSIATHLLDKGADIEFVKNFLGHQSIDTSHIYSKRRKQQLNFKIAIHRNS